MSNADASGAGRSRDEWITAFAGRLGVDPPDAATIDVLLSLAGEAAHASERTAAPIACYLVGRAGLDPVAVLDVCNSVNDR